MEPPRIHGPTAPTERVQPTRDGSQKGREEDAPKFELDDPKGRPSQPEEEREHGEVAPRGEDESGGRLDMIA